MKISKKTTPIWRGIAAVGTSLVVACGMGYGIADTWRTQVDAALGTTSFITDTSNAKYDSSYETAAELMDAAKKLAIQQGAEGTVIMKNDNNVLPLAKNSKVALFGGASYSPYKSAANNTDKVDLVSALTDAGFTVNQTVKGIYDTLLGMYTEVPNPNYNPDSQRPGQPTIKTYPYAPNTAAGDYLEAGYQIKEANPSLFVQDGGAEANWESSVTDDTVGIVTFMRPGGEGTTYRPGIARDTAGNTLDQNPLALSPDELAVVAKAKEVCSKVVVLLNTSCTIEVGPLTSGDLEVDGMAYIGIPNDYQFTGIVQALDGTVNPTGALADTYATDSAGSPAMMNFGGGYYTDYKSLEANATNGWDSRWGEGMEIANTTAGSFGGSATYSGGFYIVEAEGIYTGYNYYETRYYDSVMGQGNAVSTAGSTQGGNWDYAKEVSYTFGHGLSYLDYTQTLESVTVEDRVNGEITARVNIRNNGAKSGKFLAQLYVQQPYTQYDKDNKVEKSAIMFLSSAKVEVGASATETVEIKVPTKYIASYDSNKAKTYILDNGDYYFTVGKGAHDAVNNVLTAQGKTGDKAGSAAAVKTWNNAGDVNSPDVNTYAVSEAGVKITNVADNADLNYYLPGTVTYLSRSDWQGTYPVNYNTFKNGGGVTVADSAKKDEWIKELKNKQYEVKTNDPVKNVNGITGTKFENISDDYNYITNIEDPFWKKLVDAITMDEAVGAVAHGGSQSDTLKNIDNPIVKQYDGPNGFNRQALSANTKNNELVEGDRYYVDPDSVEGKFMPCINSQTLQGSAFDPELSLAWGRLLGNSGLWIGAYQIWGGGLNYHRSPYNGRNTEYLSEDPMLTNILGRELIKGTKEFGIICGPKHMGFNDQEYDRSGICVYMNEQKLRETDTRGFQGAIEDADALGMMVAFNRIGAINASHHKGLLVGIVRNEWDFDGLISTDMMNNKWYFNPEGCIMATVTQMADFAGNNSTLSKDGAAQDATWTYLSIDSVKNDNALVEAARECMKYQLFAFANSAILNISTRKVMPIWEAGIIAGVAVFAVISAAAAGLWIYTATKKEED